MVTPGRSTPATLSQRQVDEFARGQPGDAAALLHAARRMMPETETRDTAGNPVPLAAKEIQAIARSGAAPKRVCERIAAAGAPPKKKAKAASDRTPRGAAPTRKPPEYDKGR